MQGLLETIQKWHIHPAVDHFTVAILIIAVLADLIASLFSTRLWLRYAALALMILGTAAAWGSNVTGGWEAHRVWDAVKAAGGPGLATLQRHAQLGDILPWAFLVLSVWRIGVQLFGFMAGTRWIYLVVATLAAIAISYQGYLGGVLVYDYGIGTAAYNGGSPSPGSSSLNPQPEATGPATPIPTVYVPAATETPQATEPTIAPSENATASAMPTSTATAPGTPLPAPATPSPTASPSGSPPYGEDRGAASGR